MNNKEQKVETNTEADIVSNTSLYPVSVGKVSVEYIQESDSNSEGLQFLEVTTEDAGAGVYYVLETERWAFDTINDLVKVLNDFENRLSNCG